METLAKIIADGLPPAGASRVVALDHVIDELRTWSIALNCAVGEVNECINREERQLEDDADEVVDEADPDCTCAFCACVFAERQVDAVIADLKEATR